MGLEEYSTHSGIDTLYSDNSQSIGHTPLVKLNNIGNGNIYAKIESRNPSFSVKCRIGANMVWVAEQSGLLTKDKVLLEPTSGNTGIALAYVAAARGYRLILTMPETMSLERRRLLVALGAELILTPGSLGMKGAIEKAEEMAREEPDKYVVLQQFNNPANPAIHEATTGPEIWRATQGAIDILVSGVGTGGTITGISRFLKQQTQKAIMSVAVEPEDSPVITQTLSGQPIKPGPHKIQGIGAGFIPGNLDVSLIDKVITVTNQESFDMAHELMRKEGILAGISSGAAVSAAVKLSAMSEFRDKFIVVILPSAAERYLSSPLFDDIFTEATLK